MIALRSLFAAIFLGFNSVNANPKPVTLTFYYPEQRATRSGWIVPAERAIIGDTPLYFAACAQGSPDFGKVFKIKILQTVASRISFQEFYIAIIDTGPIPVTRYDIAINRNERTTFLPISSWTGKSQWQHAFDLGINTRTFGAKQTLAPKKIIEQIRQLEKKF